jgi:hypothetical protein
MATAATWLLMAELNSSELLCCARRKQRALVSCLPIYSPECIHQQLTFLKHLRKCVDMQIPFGYSVSYIKCISSFVLSELYQINFMLFTLSLYFYLDLIFSIYISISICVSSYLYLFFASLHLSLSLICFSTSIYIYLFI